jgi:hypothetical protein
MEPISKEELKIVVYYFQRVKSPIPNDLPIEFYLRFYDLIENDLLAVVEESRQLGKMLGAFNTTFISLIPKNTAPYTFDDFRPISLCKSIYKIITKVIARRIMPILLEAISSEHLNGF